MNKKILIIMSQLCIAILVFTVFTAFQDKKPWAVPEKNARMANPVASNAESIKAGKELWVQHCQSCHGKTGHGDGSKAAQLKTEPGNFSLPEAQKQSDGAWFYKITEGRDDMPGFKKKIPDADDTWSLVNFMRTLKS